MRSNRYFMKKHNKDIAQIEAALKKIEIVNKDRIIHPLKHVPDTDDTKHDKYGRVSTFRDKNGVWQLKIHKDLKKATPDNVWKKGDSVILDGVVSIGANKKPLHGEFVFDSYDAWNNTCYVATNASHSMTYNILLTDLNAET